MVRVTRLAVNAEIVRTMNKKRVENRTDRVFLPFAILTVTIFRNAATSAYFQEMCGGAIWFQRNLLAHYFLR